MNNARNPSHWTPSLTKPMRCHYLILKGLSKTQSSICKVVWRYICELRTLNIYCWLLRAGEKRTKWWPDHQYKQSCNAEKQLPSLLLSAVVFSVLNTRKLLSCFRITLRFIVTKNPWPANFPVWIFSIWILIHTDLSWMDQKLSGVRTRSITGGRGREL